MDALLRRRFPVESSHGTCVHEVQVANASGKWLARIVTLPDRIWRESGRRPMVFHAATREEVEGAAFARLLEECQRRGERILGLSHDTSTGLGASPARRIVAMCPLQFNQRPGRRVVGSRAIEKTFTANLSETGLFIVTGRGLGEGATIDIRLMLSGGTEKLQGLVRWFRQRAERGRPPGLGVEIVDAPLSYRSSLSTLQR